MKKRAVSANKRWKNKKLKKRDFSKKGKRKMRRLSGKNRHKKRQNRSD